MTVLIPYERGDLVSKIYALGTVEHESHGTEGTSLQVKVPAEIVDELREFQRPDLVIDE
jgi:GTP-binding protein HflX